MAVYFMGFILICAFINLMIGSASAQWAVTAPILFLCWCLRAMPGDYSGCVSYRGFGDEYYYANDELFRFDYGNGD